MQKHKSKFTDSESPKTLTDIQHCLRLNDLDEIGDGTHYLDFHMLGLFSFNQMTLQEAVDFWMDFCHHIDVIPDTVTIHPDKQEWKSLYSRYNVNVVLDPECVWSDGNIGGYCTEFYKDGVEIGNIVNTLGQHIDCGFGMERLESFYTGTEIISKNEILERTIRVLIDSDVIPSNTGRGYVLRKLIRMGLNDDIDLLNHPMVEKEVKRIERIRNSIPRLVVKNPDKDSTFFWETYGITLDELQEIYPSCFMTER